MALSHCSPHPPLHAPHCPSHLQASHPNHVPRHVPRHGRRPLRHHSPQPQPGPRTGPPTHPSDTGLLQRIPHSASPTAHPRDPNSNSLQPAPPSPPSPPSPPRVDRAIGPHALGPASGRRPPHSHGARVAAEQRYTQMLAEMQRCESPRNRDATRDVPNTNTHTRHKSHTAARPKKIHGLVTCVAFCQTRHKTHTAARRNMQSRGATCTHAAQPPPCCGLGLACLRHRLAHGPSRRLAAEPADGAQAALHTGRAG